MTDAAPTFARDFDELEPGLEFTTPGRTLTETDVVSFAGLTGDFHPQHLDAEWARESRFGERIAHGMLVLSAAAGLVPLDPDRVMALRRVSEAVLKRPVCLGDTIRVEGKLDTVREVSQEAGLAAWKWKVLNQRGEMVARMSVEVLWRRGPAAQTPEGSEPADAGNTPPSSSRAEPGESADDGAGDPLRDAVVLPL